MRPILLKKKERSWLLAYSATLELKLCAAGIEGGRVSGAVSKVFIYNREKSGDAVDCPYRKITYASHCAALLDVDWSKGSFIRLYCLLDL